MKSEQSVKIAELKASAQIQQATGEAEGIKLRAMGEAEGIRATGNAKAETYRAGVEALGENAYTAMQIMQIIGERKVRLIPDVLVGGNNGSSNSLVDGLLAMILWNQAGKQIPMPAKEAENLVVEPVEKEGSLPPVIPPITAEFVGKPSQNGNA